MNKQSESEAPEVPKLAKQGAQAHDRDWSWVEACVCARFVFADAKENEDMFAKLLESGWVEMVFEDTEAKILKIRDVKGEPPKESTDESDLTLEEKKILDDAEKTINAPNLDEDNEDTK